MKELADPVPMFDAYAPPEIAVWVREVGVAKATMPAITTVGLAVLAGAFIGALGTVALVYWFVYLREPVKGEA
jgi:formate/nitrite transporter FocA (FNT family)